MTKQAREKPNQKLKKTEIEELDKKFLFLLDDPMPKTQTERKKYVSDVALFYQTVFKKKLQHFIGLQLEELAQVGHSEEMYNTFRANINCFRLIDEWMESKTNEHIGDLENLRSQFNSNEEFISNLKKTYGED